MQRFLNFIAKFLPSVVIPDHITGEPYLVRHYLLFKDRPDWFPFNITLHHILRSDDPDSGLHDHPWNYATLILSGGYWEDTPTGTYWRGPWHIRRCKAESLHRLRLLDVDSKKETWTLFFMGKKKQRPWGFINEFNEWEEQIFYLKRKYGVKK